MSDIQIPLDQLQKTCLYSSHVALGAKMSPFAGFMMPIQYSTIVREHLAVREHVGMFDVSHMGEIFVEGPEAEAFINHIFTNEIRGFEPGKVLYGMMCYPDGGTVDDLLVYREFQPEHFLLVVNAANIDKDFAWIREQAKGFDCKVDNASPVWGQIAVQGPEAEKVVMEVHNAHQNGSLLTEGNPLIHRVIRSSNWTICSSKLMRSGLSRVLLSVHSGRSVRRRK